MRRSVAQAEQIGAQIGRDYQGLKVMNIDSPEVQPAKAPEKEAPKVDEAEAKRSMDEQLKKRAEELEAKRKAEEEERLKRAAEVEAAVAAAAKQAAEEKAAAEAEAKRKADEEERKKKEEQEKKRQRELKETLDVLSASSADLDRQAEQDRRKKAQEQVDAALAARLAEEELEKEKKTENMEQLDVEASRARAAMVPPEPAPAAPKAPSQALRTSQETLQRRRDELRTSREELEEMTREYRERVGEDPPPPDQIEAVVMTWTQQLQAMRDNDPLKRVMSNRVAALAELGMAYADTLRSEKNVENARTELQRVMAHEGVQDAAAEIAGMDERLANRGVPEAERQDMWRKMAGWFAPPSVADTKRKLLDAVQSSIDALSRFAVNSPDAPVGPLRVLQYQERMKRAREQLQNIPAGDEAGSRARAAMVPPAGPPAPLPAAPPPLPAPAFLPQNQARQVLNLNAPLQHPPPAGLPKEAPPRTQNPGRLVGNGIVVTAWRRLVAMNPDAEPNQWAWFVRNFTTPGSQLGANVRRAEEWNAAGQPKEGLTDGQIELARKLLALHARFKRNMV